MATDESANSDIINNILDGLRSSNPSIRCASIKKSSVVSKAIGSQRTREEFIPFLNEFTDDDDEVLIVLAEEVASLLPVLGGNYGYLLLTILERLAGSEEVVVRETACRSIVLVMNEMTYESFLAHIIPMYRQLSTKSWAASRASAVYLFARIYAKANSALKPELKDIFDMLCEDKNPVVRRTCVMCMQKIIETCGDDFVFLRDVLFFRNLTRFAKDELDSVRVLVPVVLPQVAVAFRANNEPIDKLLTLILMMGKDTSWRIRHAVATRLGDLWDVVRPLSPADSDSLLTCFLALLRAWPVECTSLVELLSCLQF